MHCSRGLSAKLQPLAQWEIHCDPISTGLRWRRKLRQWRHVAGVLSWATNLDVSARCASEAEGCAREGRGAGRCEGRTTGRGAGLGLRGPPRHATAAAAVVVQLALRWGSATGQLSGIWLGLWASASGGAVQSASVFIKAASCLVSGLLYEALSMKQTCPAMVGDSGPHHHIRSRGSLAQGVVGRVPKGSALGCLLI